MAEKYWVFRRSARNWEEFATATKRHVCYADSEEEARAICREFNDNRNSQQIAAGTKYEYTSASESF